jgi:excisionase family DNA binding protein
MPSTKELLNVRETARMLGVHENTIRNWEERGILRAVHLPGSGYRRFAARDVERLCAEMFEQLAPAIEGPVVNPGRKRSGRLVFGDATD